MQFNTLTPSYAPNGTLFAENQLKVYKRNRSSQPKGTQMNNFRLLLISSILFLSHTAVAEYDTDYVWDKDLTSLPKLQLEFVVDIVNAFRNSDPDLGNSRVHPDGLTKPDCQALWAKRFTDKSISSQYAVRVKDGKKEGSL